MKVSRPVTLKLDRDALLEDVRARLEQKLGAYAGVLDDPSDPGWLLVEETAWMAEILSGQLDDYPWAVLRQVVHLLGGELRPARPALGVVCLRPVRPQKLDVPGVGRVGLVFSSTATERREVVRFVPMEEGTPLVNASVDSVADIIDGELQVRAISPRGSGTMRAEVAWVAEATPSEAFEHERVRFKLLGTRTKELEEALQRGVEGLAERGVGWLSAEVKVLNNREVALDLRVDVGAAFDKAEGGLADGADLEPAWGTFEGSAWTPPVHVVDDARLPLDLRLGRPLPGTREGRLRIPDVPADFPVEDLLVREPVPMPPALVEAIWSHFVNSDRRLAAIRPDIERSLEFPDKADVPEEARWLSRVMQSDVWEGLSDGAPEVRILSIRLPAGAANAERLRLALVDDPDRGAGKLELRAWGYSKASGVHAGELEVTRPWTIPLPPPNDGPRLLRVSALELPLEPGLDGVLIATSTGVQGALLNPLLVGNMPIVTDNRDVRVQRTVPTPVSLLDEDLVSREVIADLLNEALPTSLAQHLRALPLARVGVQGEDDIEDMEGVELDPSQGELVLNAPDRRGGLRTIRPGSRLKVRWYRRTQGATGNVEANAISYIEQGSGVAPRLVRATNPLPTYYGQDRESDESAVERLFGASVGVPVLPADWEREIRIALGTTGSGWMVRVWTYAERAHLSCALWPWNEDGEEEPPTRRVRRALERAGPDTLVAFVGDPEKVLSEGELDWARRQIDGVVRRARQRVPSVRKALVGRLWTLTLHPDKGAELPPLPCYEVDEMRGDLVDAKRRRRKPPRAEVLLNAAVVKLVDPQAAVDDGFGEW